MNENNLRLEGTSYIKSLGYWNQANKKNILKEITVITYMFRINPIIMWVEYILFFWSLEYREGTIAHPSWQSLFRRKITIHEST